MTPTPPESQFANPVEMSIQTVVKGLGAMFSSQEYLPNSLWNLALLEFLDASNSCPNAVSGEYSPIFHLTRKHPLVLERFKFCLVNLQCLSSYISRSRSSHSLHMESLVLLSETHKTVPPSCIFHLIVFIACTGDEMSVHFAGQGKVFSKSQLQ
jgi:hypothetical protein